MSRGGERPGLGRGGKGCLIAALLLLCVSAAAIYYVYRRTPAVETLTGTKVYYYITPQTEISSVDFGGGARSFAVTADALLLKVGKALVELRRPDRTTWEAELEPLLLTDQLRDYDEIAADAGGVVLVSRDDGLWQLNGAGELKKVTALPAYGMHVAPSRQPGVAYVFGGHGDPSGAAGLAQQSIFLLSDADGAARRVAALEAAPKAVADAPDGYYVGTVDGNIFQLRGGNKRLVITLPRQLQAGQPDGALQSLACSDDGRILFFSTKDTVFALFGNTAVPVTKNLGGAVHWRDGVLFVWDEGRQFLVGVGGIAAALGLPAGS